MIHRIVHFALHNRALVLIVAAVMLGWGAYSFTQLEIEAYPDVMNTQVQIITQWPGHAAEEIEREISVPLETALAGVPRVRNLRSRSLFGLSDIMLTFDDGVGDYFAREQVNEAIGQANLPNGVQASMQPMTSATGEIYRYFLTGAPTMDLKSLQDWTLYRKFVSLPGVADVNGFGGTVKQYQVEIDPTKLVAYNVTLSAVTNALSSANSNAGGSYVERGGEEYVVRGIGLFRNTRDIGNVVIAHTNGTPLYIRDVATVRIGFAPRLGKVGWHPGDGGADTDDGVEGIIDLRRGENPGPVLDEIRQEVHKLNTDGELPKGVRLVPYYDRTDLVHTTSRTVERNLVEGMLLVVVVLFLFLANIRAATIVALTIPFALLFAFTCLNANHMSANLISLGAIDFGVIVNGSVIMAENIFRRLATRKSDETVMHSILHATGEVQSEVAFTTLIIITAYVPLFTLQSVESKMFSPMAYTISFALLGSLIMALLVLPILCSLFLRGKLTDKEPRVMASVRCGYTRALKWSLANPLPVLAAAVILLLISFAIVPNLGSEFLPHLDEGNLWIRMTMPSTISYTESARLMPEVRGIIAGFQPVKMVVSQLGRPDDGTDSTGFYNAEFFADLKPADQWKGFKNKDDLINRMNDKLTQIPGVTINFSQNIEDNVEEAVTGVKGELAVKLFGDDLDTLANKAAEIQNVMSKVPGVVDLTTFTETGEPQIQIIPDREKIARYGLNISDVQNVVQTAIGVNAVTQVVEGERLYDVVARLTPESRNSLAAIRNIQVSTPDGQFIPLSQLADVKDTRGASFIYREAHQRYIAIKFGVRGRALGDAVADAQRQVQQKVSFPAGYYTVWGGEFENLQRATARMAIIVPATLLLIFIMLFLLFGRSSRALLVMVTVPLALIGGIFALFITHFHLSVSAAVGFIALFGIAVQNGVIMVSYIEQLRTEGMGDRESILEGAVVRLRPVLMTAILASIGLIPAAISTGIGSDVQKPLAIVIIGGLCTQPILTLFVLPVMYSLLPKVEPAATTEAELAPV
ncbi:MAG: efflux RND transporter permease subunit [Capsulimonadaceae bacterium]